MQAYDAILQLAQIVMALHVFWTQPSKFCTSWPRQEAFNLLNLNILAQAIARFEFDMHSSLLTNYT